RCAMKRAAVPSILVAVVLLALGVIAEAQQTGKVARIGFVDSTTASGSAVLWDAFRQELSKLGWIEGKNIIIESRFAGGRNDSLPGLAAELVRLKIDLIVVPGVQSARAAMKATTIIPVVIASAPDPVGLGLVASLARPGGNVTGLSSLPPELNTTRMEIVTDAIPQLAQVGLLGQARAAGGGGDTQLKELRSAALALKLKLEEIETQADAKGLENAFQIVKQKQVGAIMTGAARTFFAERKRIVEFAEKYRLPAIYIQKEFVDEGGLMSYGTDYGDQFIKAANVVDKIMKGSKPADLPVQQATKFEFVINLKAAKQIGLTIPPDVLARANKVVK